MQPWEGGRWQTQFGLHFFNVFFVILWPCLWFLWFFYCIYGFLVICWRVPGVVTGWVPCSIAGWSHAENTRKYQRAAERVLSPATPPRIHTYMVTTTYNKGPKEHLTDQHLSQLVSKQSCTSVIASQSLRKSNVWGLCVAFICHSPNSFICRGSNGVVSRGPWFVPCSVDGRHQPFLACNS